MSEVTSIDYINHNNIEQLDLKNIPTDDLKRGLLKSLEITAKNLMLLAKIWVELESRGIDLTEFKTGISQYLGMIGYGQLDPNVVIRFAGQQTLLTNISSLPVNLQKQVLEINEIEYVQKTESGRIVKKIAPIDQIRAANFRYIFDDKGIRSIAEQRKLLLGKKQRRTRAIRKKSIFVNQEDGYVQINNLKVRLDDLLNELKKAKQI